MRVERRKFPLFLPDFGAILYFFTDSIVASRVQGGKYRGLPPMRGIVRMLQSLLRGGGEGGMGLCEVYRETTKIWVIRSEFSPMALDTFTSRRKLNITVLEGVYVYKVYRDSQNLSSDPTFCPWHLTHSHPVGKNITILEGMTRSRVTFNSLENLVPAQVSVQSRAESQKKHSNTTQQNGTELEAN